MPRVSEFFESDGSVRSHQRLLSEFLRAHTAEQHEALRHAVQSRLREQEVSYNVFGAPDYSHRPWRLDEVPHLLPGEEFDRLARGMSRRGQLLEACLKDIYGPQRLLRERVIPPDVVLGNPHFFRTLHGVIPLGPTRLVLFASDVVKSADGAYLVHSDRTAAPTGSGYALENRLVMGQILSEPFRKYRTRKINRFFDVMRQTLREFAPASGVPRIVLLTPGVEDESSFEHAYLARYQGYELVEGRDLTVRGEEVFLKTLEGLKKVDVILRRVADDWCDPLELREDSILGVSGLVGAARAQTVGIANALGSGIIESPAFRAYLPAMSMALLGEPLMLDSIPTRHLGDPEQCEEVLDSFADWIFRPAFGDRRGEAQVAGALDLAAQEELKKAVLAEPQAYVAEKWPDASTVPTSSRLDQEGALSLRLFACRVGAEYFVLPGGLGRVDDTPDGMFIAPRESTSKDVWVVGDAHSEVPSPPRMPDEQLTIRRGGVGLPSRLFDDIYWLSRYAERCYGTARLVRTGLEPITSEDRDLPPELMDALVRTLISMQIVTPTGEGAPQFERALLAAIYDRDRENTIRYSLDRMHDLTTRARSRLSRDAWRILRRLTGIFDRIGEQEMTVDQAVDQLDELLLALSAFHGIISSNMVRGHAWIFLELGRRLEHSVFVLTLLNQLFQKPGSRILMETLLTICDSLLTYRSRYLSALQAAPAVDLVLTDDSNPQSVLFQLRRLLECVRSLPREEKFPLSRAEQRLIILQARLETADVYRACRDKATDLRDLAEEGINLLWQVSDDLTQTYFMHASRHHAMAPAQRVDLGGETV